MSFLPETENGNIEHKRVINATGQNTARLATQLRRRVIEGRGMAIYRIGVEDDGTIFGLDADNYRTSLETIHDLAEIAKVTVQRVEEHSRINSNKVELYYATITLMDHTAYSDLYVVTIGCVNAGKSTLIGTLMSGEHDDGNSKNANRVANHEHERRTGNTSSIAYQIVGINGDRIINDENALLHAPMTWNQIVSKSNRVITFSDLAGHQKYLGATTIRGICENHVDYCLAMVNAVKGINSNETDMNLTELLRRGKDIKKTQPFLSMMEEHMKLAFIWKIPVIALMTHIDVATPEELAKSMGEFAELAKRMKMSIVQITDEITPQIVEQCCQRSIIPMIHVSCKTGQNLSLVKKMLTILPVNRTISANTELEISIDDIYEVRNVGKVVSGYVNSGHLIEGMRVKIGPFSDKTYHIARVKSIENKRVRTMDAHAGQHVTVALQVKDIPRIRKGMYLLDVNSVEIATHHIRARIQLQNQSTITVRNNFQCMFYAGSIRVSSYIEKIQPFERDDAMTKRLDSMRAKLNNTAIKVISQRGLFIGPGETASVDLSLQRCIYITKGTRFVWSDNRVTGIGVVEEIYD